MRPVEFYITFVQVLQITLYGSLHLERATDVYKGDLEEDGKGEVNFSRQFFNITLPKAQRTRGLSSSCQSNFLRSGLHKLWYPGIRDTSTWSKFRAHGEHGDVFLFSNLGAL